MSKVSMLLLVIGVGVFLVIGSAKAQYSSSNYTYNEAFFGSGGDLDISSASYQAKVAVGELGIGNITSSNYQAQAGFNTTDAPYLEAIVTGASIDLGYLDTAVAKTGSTTFSVKAYLAGAYSVVTQSDPPVNSGSFMANLTSPTASSPGTEQFGINLVANTSPAVGANPNNNFPDTSFSFGAAATGYNTADQFKYVKGDTIATSSSSSGQTTYTVSYLFNISDVTLSGEFVFNHRIVVVATY